MLKKFAKDALAEEGEVEYTRAAEGYFSTTDWLNPRCVFTPLGVSDVAKGVAILKECKAKFAVKGGGHMVVS